MVRRQTSIQTEQKLTYNANSQQGHTFVVNSGLLSSNSLFKEF